jgi:hypothetical protein
MPVDLNGLLAAADEVAERLRSTFDYMLEIESRQTDWFTIDGVDRYQPCWPR